MSGSHGRFVWYELATTDIEAAKAFYSEMLGWAAEDSAAAAGAYTFFCMGGVPVSGVMRLPEDAVQSGFRSGWLGYLGVDDVDRSAERAEQLGGVVLVPPKDIPAVSRFSVVLDPQMATVGLLRWHPG